MPRDIKRGRLSSETVTFRIPSDLRDKVGEIAEAEGRTFSDIYIEGVQCVEWMYDNDTDLSEISSKIEAFKRKTQQAEHDLKIMEEQLKAIQSDNPSQTAIPVETIKETSQKELERYRMVVMNTLILEISTEEIQRLGHSKRTALSVVTSIHEKVSEMVSNMNLDDCKEFIDTRRHEEDIDLNEVLEEEQPNTNGYE